MIAQTVQLTPAARDTVARMADLLRSRAGSGEGVTREELLLEFSPGELDAHFEAAKARARRAGKARQ